MRTMGAGSIVIEMQTGRETAKEIGKDVRKKRSDSGDRTRNGGRGGSVMMEKAPIKRERRKAKRKRSMFGKRERMRMLATPQVTFKLTNLRRLLKILKRMKMGKGIV